MEVLVEKLILLAWLIQAVVAVVAAVAVPLVGKLEDLE
jgi:hypothetical protein